MPLDAVRCSGASSAGRSARRHAFTVTPVPLDDDIFVSSYRQIIDLAGADSSHFVIPMGQSGHIWSERYANLLDKWTKVEYLPMRFTRLAVDETASAAGLEPRSEPS
jgi:acyl-homoserine lactone acylase PvdQ